MDRARKRLLFLLPFPPRLDGTHGGSRAIAQLLSHLAVRHTIAVVCLRGGDEPGSDECLRERLDVVEEIQRPWSGGSTAHQLIRKGRMALSLMSYKPTWVTHCRSEAYAAAVHSLAAKWRPDLIQIEYHVMGQYLPALRDCNAPRILTNHEPGTRAASLKDSWFSVSWLLHHLERKAWSHFEPRIIRQVQAVVVFTEEDRQAIAAMAPTTPIAKIPLGVDCSQTPMDPLGSFPRSLLFFGNFIHPPNVDAALRSVRGIFPSLEARFPDLELYIVGENPPLELIRIRNPKIHVTGRVPDLAPYINRASVVLAPLRLGGGMRLKVLESLAAGKAVVASACALEGLDIIDRETVCKAESDAEFCAAITELLASPEKRRRLARSARAWARENLGWEKSIAQYETLHAHLLRRAQRIQLVNGTINAAQKYSNAPVPSAPGDKEVFS